MTLTNFPHDPILDLDPWVGQRSASFRFELIDGVTGEHRGDITPVRNATLNHDTTRVIKRRLSINLGVRDTAFVNPLRDRINVFMVFPGGREEPLGRYMFTDTSRQKFTSGKLGNFVLNDEMFLVDQEISKAINGVGKSVTNVIVEVLSGLPITFVLEASSFISTEAWGIGTGRGQITEALSVSGDYFSPWFDNNGTMRFIRTFNPANAIPDFDFDANRKVIREPIIETDDLLTAPNKFIVISNATTDPTAIVTATATTPNSAPFSAVNRGFEILRTFDLQLSSNGQAQAVVQGLVERQTVFERVVLSTAPDPRHDGYNVIRWDGANWLELAWSMALKEGGEMNHLLRKAYSG